MIVLMKKLKILLQSNILIILLFLFTLLMLFNAFKKSLYKEENLGNQNIQGIIKNIEVGEYNTKLTINDMLVSVSNSNFKLGEKVSCSGEVTLPIGERNFYLFNYQKYLASKNIHYMMKGECKVLATTISPFYQIKNWITNRIEKRKSYAYLKAFLLGDSKEIKEDVKRSYQINGISHLFAVSGMHIGLFFLVFGKIVKNERRKNVILFLFLIFYLFLTNFSPSVIRASLFFFFANFLKRFGFTKVQSFLVFTFLILWYQPYFLYHTGFLYSFTISFFLLLFSNYISKEKNYWKTLIKVSLLALLSSIPIQIQTNFSINLFSIFYNLLFVPIVSEFLFPLSFLVFLFPILDSFYFFLLSILETISLFFSTIPSILVLCHLPVPIFLGYYGILLFLMHKIMIKEYKYIVVLFLLLAFHFYFPRLNPNGMVLMMDIGQGDSTLVIYPYQKLKILIDTGGAYYDTKLASNTILPTLHAHGITSLDYLILSHGDLDHIGEALSLLKNIKIKKVIFNSGNDTEAEKRIMDYLSQKQIPYEKLSKNILNNNGESILFLNTKKSDNENEDSLVCYFKIRNYSLLFMGDSGALTEKALLQEYNLPSVDILKVGHHGSKYSSTLEFVRKINPNTCLISAGENNRYGHPHKETIQNLQSCDTYITSIDGAIKINLGKSMRVTKVR